MINFMYNFTHKIKDMMYIFLSNSLKGDKKYKQF